MQNTISSNVSVTMTKQSKPLTQWMKEYATYAGVTTFKPDFDSVLAVAKSCLQDSQLDTRSVDELLRSIGIDVIAQYGNDRIAWLGSISESEVEEMLQKFQQPEYSKIRKSLDIEHLWILKIQDDLCHSKRDIFEALVEFSDMDEQPECVIIDL